jgi:serine/threonine protein kinase
MCRPISKHKIDKYGFRTHLTEAATMRYLSEHTSIPVPKVYSSFVRKNIAYIVMERIQGEEISKVWKSMSMKTRESVFTQLRQIFEELRSLRPPSNEVQSCVGGSPYDSRIPRGNPRFGPFKTIQDFHYWLRHDFKMEDVREQEKDQDYYNLDKFVKRQDGP